MANTQPIRNATEDEARALAEESRETSWNEPSFMKEMFLGNFHFDLITPYPLHDQWRPDFTKYYDELKTFLINEWDPIEVDATGEYPEAGVQRLREMGAFGMKIPTEYGGLGFNQVEYGKVMELIGAYDGNLGALLSAHQSIGVPQPVKLFGSDYLKKTYLPRCAAGEISAFALTEHDVGSDPARLTTTAEDKGDHYLINGTKLWCTNGTLATMLVVMARDMPSNKISAFVVETAWEGVNVLHRCRFMGLKALANAVIEFKDVKVPKENLIGDSGRGLKIALTTLNDGRLSIPNAVVGGSKRVMKQVREWAAEREQWGRPIGKHEAVAQKLADMNAMTFAMESIVKWTTDKANNKKLDLRLESAACKEWNTDKGWQVLDDAMQIRGGRGYEMESSLIARGVRPDGIDRAMRDSRINRIFEGSSEIMHLLMAREAVDKHLQVAGAFVDKKSTLGDKISALPSIMAFYVWWYPSRWIGMSWFKYGEYGRFAKHLRFVDRSARRLARTSFHGMMVYQAKLERKQMFLFRLVDVVNELFAMSASIARAVAMEKAGDVHAAQAAELADVFCAGARRRVEASFNAAWRNDDAQKYKVANGVLDGQHVWMEELVEGLDTMPKAKEAVEEPELAAASK